MGSLALQGACISSPIRCWSAAFRCYSSRSDQVQGLATRVLGSSQQAIAWLKRPAIGLDWRAPCRLLVDVDGYHQVVNYLERIEYGVYC